MSDSYSNTMPLIKLYIQRGEIERSKELAEEVIRDNPEEPPGYLLMAYHYYLLQQSQEARTWLEETRKRAPEEEGILVVMLAMYEDLQFDESERRELIETGLRLYPENAFFHARYAPLIEKEDISKSLASYQEAIRLNPHDEECIGDYARLLYRFIDKQKQAEAEKYEALALQENPENIKNLVNFALIAYEQKKYKKAQLLIDQAMRLNPENQTIREHYKKIYPTKNRFVRFTRRFNETLGNILFAWPARLLFYLFFKKLSPVPTVIFLLVAETVGGYMYFGNNLFILFAMYLFLLYVNSRVKKSILKKAGFTNAEEEAMEKNARVAQRKAIFEMEKTLINNRVDQKIEPNRLSPDELEAQLTQIWNTDSISEIKKNTDMRPRDAKLEPVNEEPPKEIDSPQEPNPFTQNNQTTGTVDWPKEYRKWPTYLIMAAMLIGFIIRLGPGMTNDDTPEPVSQELRESITEAEESVTNKNNKAIIEANKPIVEQFIESAKEKDTNALSQTISDNYKSSFQEKIDNPLLKQLASAKIEKAEQSQSVLPTTYFLLVNDDQRIKVVVEVFNKEITNLYANNWSDSLEDQEKYASLLKKLELNGVQME